MGQGDCRDALNEDSRNLPGSATRLTYGNLENGGTEVFFVRA